MLRSFRELDAAFDVDGAAARALELADEAQARGDSDAGSPASPSSAPSSASLGRAFESAQDLIARVVEVLLVELVHSRAMSHRPRPLVQDHAALAHELDAERVEVARPFVERLAECLA